MLKVDNFWNKMQLLEQKSMILLECDKRYKEVAELPFGFSTSARDLASANFLSKKGYEIIRYYEVEEEAQEACTGK